MLVRSWEHRGLLLEALEAFEFLPSWGVLGAFWAALRPLGGIWGRLGSLTGRLGALLGRPGTILWVYWPLLISSCGNSLGALA